MSDSFEKPKPKGIRRIYLVIGAVIVFALAGTAGFLIGSSRNSLTIEYSNRPAGISDARAGLADVADMQAALRASAENILPAVVSVEVLDIVERSGSSRNFYEYFFGGDDSPEIQEGLGSGVIISRDGDTVYVLSNNHVAGDADEILLSLYDGRQFNGTLVGQDPGRDLAIISFITDEEVPMAQIGNSDDLRVGDVVMAVGSPLGYSSSVTRGIVSALGRESTSGSQIAGFTDYIQTDAAINPGNSGGALVNLYGELVGINTWIASGSGGSIGIGFAIPVNNVRFDEIISNGSVSYGWLGVSLSNVQDSAGSRVSSIISDSPAARAGLLPGDIITSVDDREIEDANALSNAIGRLAPDTTTVLSIQRGEDQLQIAVTLARRPSDEERADLNASIWPGFTLSELTDNIRSRLNLSRNEGNLMISSVGDGTAAESAGLRRGDIIRSINGINVDTLDDFYAELNQQVDELNLGLYRQGMSFSIGLPVNPEQ